MKDLNFYNNNEKAWFGYYLYSSTSSYPFPVAHLINCYGRIIHSWSNSINQPPVEDNPPNFLRGWNHVAVDKAGSLFCIIPLHSLIKLDKYSNLLWEARISAHHDLAYSENGDLFVLTESPRFHYGDRDKFLFLDNEITVLNSSGEILRQYSIYEILQNSRILQKIIEVAVRERQHSLFQEYQNIDLNVKAFLETSRYTGSKREALKQLRQLPGSPCDLLHTNSLAILGAHPSGLWKKGNVLISLRNLNLIVVLDLDKGSVVWFWGRGVLSGQHQPSALPNGNVLIFDNGANVGRSRLLEVNPVHNSISWEYYGSPMESFFSALAGGCELLPN